MCMREEAEQLVRARDVSLLSKSRVEQGEKSSRERLSWITPFLRTNSGKGYVEGRGGGSGREALEQEECMKS
nr:hypothetical protein Iba_chr14dCG12640 [Ipomoea batatas]